MGVLQSWYLAYWWVSNCFFHELSYVKSLYPPFLSLFSMSFVLPSTICLVSWIPRIPVLCTPVCVCNWCILCCRSTLIMVQTWIMSIFYQKMSNQPISSVKMPLKWGRDRRAFGPKVWFFEQHSVVQRSLTTQNSTNRTLGKFYPIFSAVAKTDNFR